MKSALNSIRIERPKTNAFDLSHDVKFSGKMGELIPVTVMECVPGDRIRISGEAIVRFAPLVAPMMQRVDMFIHYFFVPNRLLWKNWEKWITNGGDDINQVDPLPAHPFVRYEAAAASGIAGFTRLMNFMGLPEPGVDVVANVAYETISALPFAAYQMIFDEYYRDENLVEKVLNKLTNTEDEYLDDGNNSDQSELFQIRKRAWEADYFTKALPFTQKGQPVEIPIGFNEDLPVMKNTDPSSGGSSAQWSAAISNTVIVDNVQSDDPTVGQDYLYAPTEFLDGSTTINELRTAARLQEWLEINARSGTRYSELIRSHYGVDPKDSRLQRPEYITGVKSPVQISEVLNTTGTTELPQGNMAGHGVTYAKGNFGKYFCTEHGYIMGIMSVMPKTSYWKGIPRHFLKYEHPTQIYFPKFANLGEQEVKYKEVYAFQPETGGTLTFGYQPRHQEYKSLNSQVNGEFRTSLKHWHMGRDLEEGVSLNDDFVSADPTTRVFAVTSEEVDNLYCHVLNNVMAIRPMPVYATPTL